MKYILTCTLLFAQLTMATLCHADTSTTVSGNIYFRDLDNSPLEPKYVEQLPNLLKVWTHDWNTQQQLKPLKVKVSPIGEEADEKFVPYTFKVTSSFKVPLRVRLNFGHGNFFLDCEASSDCAVPLWQHAGSLTNPLYIVRRFKDRVAMKRYVLAALAEEAMTKETFHDTLSVVESMIDQTSDPELFILAEKLLETSKVSLDVIDAQTMHFVMNLRHRENFKELSSPEKFRVLSGLAYWFARAEEIQQAVPPDLTFFEVAQHFFARSTGIVEHSIDGIDILDAANAFQNYYEIECKYGSAEDCFLVIRSFADVVARYSEKDVEYSTARLQSFYKAFVTRLETETGLVPPQFSSNDAFYAHVAGNPNLKGYWEMFVETVDASGRRTDLRKSAALERALTHADKILSR